MTAPSPAAFASYSKSASGIWNPTFSSSHGTDSASQQTIAAIRPALLFVPHFIPVSYRFRCSLTASLLWTRIWIALNFRFLLRFDTSSFTIWLHNFRFFSFFKTLLRSVDVTRSNIFCGGFLRKMASVQTHITRWWRVLKRPQMFRAQYIRNKTAQLSSWQNIFFKYRARPSL